MRFLPSSFSQNGWGRGCWNFLSRGDPLVKFPPKSVPNQDTYIAGVCGCVTQSSWWDSLWLLKVVILPYCPPRAATSNTDSSLIPYKVNHRKLCQHKTVQVFLHLFFLLVHHLKLAYPQNSFETLTYQEKRKMQGKAVNSIFTFILWQDLWRKIIII